MSITVVKVFCMKITVLVFSTVFLQKPSKKQSKKDIPTKKIIIIYIYINLYLLI